MAPLDGLLVADFSRVLAGPLASMLLGDLGADVVNVERPDGGDDTRAWGPPRHGEVSTYYLALKIIVLAAGVLIALKVIGLW